MKEGETEQKKIKSERKREAREKFNETKREKRIERANHPLMFRHYLSWVEIVTKLT